MTQHWLQSSWTLPRSRHLILEALIAVCLAFIVWLYINSRSQQTLDYVPIPVSIQLAPNDRDQYLLDTPGTPRVIASFFGPAARIRELRRNLQYGHMKMILLYTVAGDRRNEAVFSDTVRIEPAQLPVPPGVTVELVESSRAISLTVHRLAERVLPVKLEYTGDARVTQIKTEPATVLVRGPKSVLDRATTVATIPYVFPDQTDETSNPAVKDHATLATELEGRSVQVTPAQVAFRCKVTPWKKVYDLCEVPVQFLCPPQFPWRPSFADDRHAKISLRLIGPALDEPPPVLAYVDLTKGSYGRGRNLEPLRVQLPKDFQLADNTPLLVAFQLQEMERTAAEVVEP